MHDAESIREVYGADAVGDLVSRLADSRTEAGTTHYVVESDALVVAVFSVTALARLRPGGKSRLILHEIKFRPNLRGTGIAGDIFQWLATSLAVGTEYELLALTAPGQQPAVFDDFGLSESHHVFKWPVRSGGERT
ncbi:hypothetical protein [Streptomyces yangpuensis]|uniref:hypothetical protein n=1 Tax=Streptomyces yangpuensis TaxID=1648182 RepID=UPI00382660AA